LGPESGGSVLAGELLEQPTKLMAIKPMAIKPMEGAETATLAVTNPMTENETRIREELKIMP
jgi:hypothetical protein